MPSGDCRGQFDTRPHIFLSNKFSDLTELQLHNYACTRISILQQFHINEEFSCSVLALIKHLLPLTTQTGLAFLTSSGMSACVPHTTINMQW